MSNSSNHRNGCTSLGLLSLLASTQGSILASIIYAVLVPDSFSHSEINGFARYLFAALVAFFFGVFIALPIGAIFGIPLLAISKRFIIAHVESATVAFASAGLMGSLALLYLDDPGGLGNAPYIFGACVGGMHPLVYARANGAKWHRIATAFMISAAALPLLAYAGEAGINYFASQAEFETRCADHYGSMAVVADTAALKQSGDRTQFTGKWLNQLKWRSLYAREDRVQLDEAHTLIARDYALVPDGFVGWIGGGRRVERHCLSEKKGGAADMLRNRRFGKPPSLQDLAD